MRSLLFVAACWWLSAMGWVCAAGQADIVIVSHGGNSLDMGYADEGRFRADAQRVIEYHLAREPYKSRAADLSWHILWNPTSLDCQRSSTMTRLIGCNSTKARAAIVAAGLPVEVGIILVNSSDYGGSGGTPFAVAYNGCSTCSTPKKVAVHEFGHTLGGLLDEYKLVGTKPAENAWAAQCWKGADPPTVPGRWVQGCYAPNYWRQQVQRPDGSWTSSVMKSLSYPQFNAKSLELLNRRLDYWVAQP